MISHKYKSPNFNERDTSLPLKYIIIHYTGVKSPFSDICKWFEKPSSAVSCHYAIDYDDNGYIDLKSNQDAYASASNYLNKIGWKSDQPCFYRVNLSENVPTKYLNISAKKLHNKKKLKDLRKYIKNNNQINNKYNNLNVAIITPDKDIVLDAETLNPAYIVFDNYEIILKWNRSLRFALAVCTLKDKFKNEL